MAAMNGSADLVRPINIQTATSSSVDSLKDYKTLYGVLRCFAGGIISSDGGGGGDGSPPPPLVERIKKSFLDQAPHLREASRNSAGDLLRWTREDGPLRALFVISVSVNPIESEKDKL